MADQSGLLSKTRVIGILILLIGMSVVSSIIGIAEDKSPNNNFLESANNSKEGLSCDHSAYILGDGPNCYLYEFILNNASDLNCVCEGSSVYISHATWSSDNYIYFTQYGSGLLYVIDIDTCEIWCIGGGGTSLNGLAYDLTTNRMFGVGEQDLLYEIDPDTGEQELIGEIGGSVYCTVGLTFDSEGTLYGWNLGNNKIWKIDKETGEAIIVGDLGFNINYTCDGDFCKEDDILYIVHENKLYMYDLDKGQSELIDEFPDYVSVTGLAIPYANDDTISPVTTHTLDPPEPNGCNGWYVSDINITLNATDDISGVKEIHYKVAEDEWKIHSGDYLTIVLDYDCLIDGLIEFYAVDFAGNQEEIKSVGGIDIDQLPPRITLSYEIIGGNPIQGWDILFETAAIDDCSGMYRVEFYLNDVLQDTVTGPGPVYQWDFHSLLYSIFRVNGLICKLEITEESVEFFSIIVKISGSWSPDIRISTCAYDNACNFDCDEILDTSTSPIKPGLYLFQNVTLPNNYNGYIGRFFIFARFDTR